MHDGMPPPEARGHPGSAWGSCTGGGGGKGEGEEEDENEEERHIANSAQRGTKQQRNDCRLIEPASPWSKIALSLPKAKSPDVRVAVPSEGRETLTVDTSQRELLRRLSSDDGRQPEMSHVWLPCVCCA